MHSSKGAMPRQVHRVLCLTCLTDVAVPPSCCCCSALSGSLNLEDMGAARQWPCSIKVPFSFVNPEDNSKVVAEHSATLKPACIIQATDVSDPPPLSEHDQLLEEIAGQIWCMVARTP